MKRSRLNLLIALVLISVSVVTAHMSAAGEPSRYASDPVKTDSSGDGATLVPNAGEPDVGQNSDQNSVEQSVGELRQFSPVVGGLGAWASALRFLGLGF